MFEGVLDDFSNSEPSFWNDLVARINLSGIQVIILFSEHVLH